MEKKNIVILGSTGSIGKQALDLVREHPDRFNVVALSCQSSWEKLAGQVREFEPDYALLCDEKNIKLFRNELNNSVTEILSGRRELIVLASLDKADIILNSLVGFSGFEPTLAALKAGNKVALANKESLVIGGELIEQQIPEWRNHLIPVDSEHSAIFQCLRGESNDSIEKLIITASGGPFRTYSESDMSSITVDDALNHPNWSMGDKITIDSATMMNKGLEIIEAYWLFKLSLSKIEAVIHPQSVVHSIVTFTDGSSKAQLGPPTMKVPILYALAYPERMNLEEPRLDWDKTLDLTFEPIDRNRFPCLELAMDAIRKGGLAPAILNAANEVAVNRFLNEEISYIKIPAIIESCLNSLDSSEDITLNAITEINRTTRELALTF